MKRGVIIVGAVFAVALAAVIGNRMSTDAMAVVVGVVCGVLASVPTSLLLIWVMGRRGQETATSGDRLGLGSHYPPVVVVNPGPGYGVPGYGPSLNLAAGYPAGGSLPLPGGPRDFKVVGDEETLLDELRHVFPGLEENWMETP